jgi:uncharacterized protein with LGFP repeats
MQRRYTHLGSEASPLGASIGPERHGERGTRQRFVHGRMYHSDHTGTHFVLGVLAAKYVHLGESGSPLGLPTSDTHDNLSGTGRHNLFQRGSIHASNQTDAHSVWGPVFTAWQAAGQATSPLGLPTTDTQLNADGIGEHNAFENGVIYYSPALGTHSVLQPVLAVWDAHERETGPLGYPADELGELPSGMGQSQPFANGVIDVMPDLGTHAVWGPIFQSWVAPYGRETGSLGRPTSDVYAVDPTHDRCDFEHGSLVLDKTTGTVSQTQ